MICASIKNSEMKDVMDKLSKVPEEYDLVEIWINEIEDLDLESLIGKATKPLLIKFTDVTDKDLISKCLEKKVAYIDLDIDMIDQCKEVLKNKTNTKLIISYHDYLDTPSLKEARALVAKIKEMDADIAKVIFTANKCEDNLIPIHLIHDKTIDIISFCMTREGRLSRVISPNCGSVIAFVPPSDEWKTGEGQLNMKEWKDIQNTINKYK